MLRLFISSVQKEFATERKALRDYLTGDPLMRRVFVPFFFEDAPSAVPVNPLLAEPLYLAKYIERMGTGTRDMIRLCREAGLPEPEFAVRDGFVTTVRRPPQPVTPEATPQAAGQVAEEVRRVMLILKEDMSRQQLQQALSLSGRANFEERYLKPALEGQWIELTIPSKPTSRLQKYRLTPKGRAWLAKAQPPT